MTNGIVSVTVGGSVRLKLVTGCYGYNASSLASDIRAMARVPSVDEAIDLARRHGFAGASLVVQTPEGDVAPDMAADEVGPLYRERFADPRSNPRWPCGSCDHVEVVEVGA